MTVRPAVPELEDVERPARASHVLARPGSGHLDFELVGDSGDQTQVSVGEVKVGSGLVRIVGGAPPTPSEALDHRFGLRDYAPTYTGLFIMENAIQHDAADLGTVAPPSNFVPHPAKSRRCVSGQRLKVKLSRKAGRSAQRGRVLVNGRARKAKVKRVEGRLVATLPLRAYRGKKLTVKVKRGKTTVQKRAYRICL